MWVNNNNLYKFYTVAVVVGHHYPTVIVNVYRVNFPVEAKILFCNKQLMMYELSQENKLIHSQYYYSLQRYKSITGVAHSMNTQLQHKIVNLYFC